MIINFEHWQLYCLLYWSSKVPFKGPIDDQCNVNVEHWRLHWSSEGAIGAQNLIEAINWRNQMDFIFIDGGSMYWCAYSDTSMYCAIFHSRNETPWCQQVPWNSWNLKTLSFEIGNSWNLKILSFRQRQRSGETIYPGSYDLYKSLAMRVKSEEYSNRTKKDLAYE